MAAFPSLLITLLVLALGGVAASNPFLDFTGGLLNPRSWDVLAPAVHDAAAADQPDQNNPDHERHAGLLESLAELRHRKPLLAALRGEQLDEEDDHSAADERALFDTAIDAVKKTQTAATKVAKSPPDRLDVSSFQDAVERLAQAQGAVHDWASVALAQACGGGGGAGRRCAKDVEAIVGQVDAALREVQELLTEAAGYSHLDVAAAASPGCHGHAGGSWLQDAVHHLQAATTRLTQGVGSAVEELTAAGTEGKDAAAPVAKDLVARARKELSGLAGRAEELKNAAVQKGGEAVHDVRHSEVQPLVANALGKVDAWMSAAGDQAGDATAATADSLKEVLSHLQTWAQDACQGAGAKAKDTEKAAEGVRPRASAMMQRMLGALHRLHTSTLQTRESVADGLTTAQQKASAGGGAAGNAARSAGAAGAAVKDRAAHSWRAGADAVARGAEALLQTPAPPHPLTEAQLAALHSARAVRDTFRVTTGAVTGAFSAAGSAVTGAAAAVGHGIQYTAAAAQNAVYQTTHAVSDAVLGTASAVGGAVQGTAAVVGGAVQGTAAAVGGAVHHTAAAAQNAAHQAVAGVASAAGHVADACVGTACAVGSAAQHTVGAVGSAAQQTAGAVGSAAQHTAGAIGGAAHLAASGAASAVHHTVDACVGAACAVGGAAQHTANAVGSAAQHTASAVGNAAQHCVDGVCGVVQGTANAAAQLAQQTGAACVGVAHHGYDAATGAACAVRDGLYDGACAVGDAACHTAAAARGAAHQGACAVGDAACGAAAAARGAAQRTVDGACAVGDATCHAAAATRNAAQRSVHDAVASIQQATDALTQALSSAVGGATDTTKDAAGAASRSTAKAAAAAERALSQWATATQHGMDGAASDAVHKALKALRAVQGGGDAAGGAVADAVGRAQAAGKLAKHAGQDAAASAAGAGADAMQQLFDEGGALANALHHRLAAANAGGTGHELASAVQQGLDLADKAAHHAQRAAANLAAHLPHSVTGAVKDVVGAVKDAAAAAGGGDAGADGKAAAAAAAEEVLPGGSVDKALQLLKRAEAAAEGVARHSAAAARRWVRGATATAERAERKATNTATHSFGDAVGKAVSFEAMAEAMNEYHRLARGAAEGWMDVARARAAEATALSRELAAVWQLAVADVGWLAAASHQDAPAALGGAGAGGTRRLKAVLSEHSAAAVKTAARAPPVAARLEGALSGMVDALDAAARCYGGPLLKANPQGLEDVTGSAAAAQRRVGAALGELRKLLDGLSAGPSTGVAGAAAAAAAAVGSQQGKQQQQQQQLQPAQEEHLALLSALVRWHSTSGSALDLAAADVGGSASETKVAALAGQAGQAVAAATPSPVRSAFAALRRALHDLTHHVTLPAGLALPPLDVETAASQSKAALREVQALALERLKGGSSAAGRALAKVAALVPGGGGGAAAAPSLEAVMGEVVTEVKLAVDAAAERLSAESAAAAAAAGVSLTGIGGALWGAATAPQRLAASWWRGAGPATA